MGASCLVLLLQFQCFREVLDTSFSGLGEQLTTLFLDCLEEGCLLADTFAPIQQ